MTDEEITDFLEGASLRQSRRSSIETLLHAWLPARHVDHVHADAVCALTHHVDAEATVKEVLGGEVGFVPYLRPGFALAKLVAEHASADAVVLSHHGLVTWGDTAAESLEKMFTLVTRAEEFVGLPRSSEQVPTAMPDDQLDELLLRLRGRLSPPTARVVLAVDHAARTWVDRPDIDDLAAAGPATPDHLNRTNVRPIVVRAPIEVDAAADAFESWYEAFFRRQSRVTTGEFVMRSPVPTIALVPGVGLVGAAAGASDARLAASAARHSLSITGAARDAFGETRLLSEAELFAVDYWPLQRAKLAISNSREFLGRVVIVTGAASGIGRAIALRLVELGANAVLADIDSHGLDETCEIASGSGETPITVVGDLATENQAQALVTAAVRSFGGVDGAVLNAGVGAPGELEELTLAQWQRSLDINATAHFLLTKGLLRAMRIQGLGGSLVYVASKNAFAPGAGFGAYSVAKAGQVQLARIAAIEGGRIGVRSNVVNPDAIFGGSGLWSEELRSARARAHGIAIEDLERFYADRTLLGKEVRGEDVAEACTFLLSDRASRTTGCVITVDGGVSAAFPR